MALKQVDGVEDADVSYEMGSALVTFDPDVTSPAEFIDELTRLTGFTAEVVEMNEGMMPMLNADSTTTAERSH